MFAWFTPFCISNKRAVAIIEHEEEKFMNDYKCKYSYLTVYRKCGYCLLHFQTRQALLCKEQSAACLAATTLMNQG